MDNTDQIENGDGLYNFPNYPNLFIGRGFHLQSISNLFHQGHIRLLTLLGPGGIGKTRLSVEVAKRLRTFFEDGIYFVPLDMINHSEEVPRYLGQALKLPKRSNYSWEEEVLEFLVRKKALLILDNLEQILDIRTFIGQLLDHCPQLKILATSREILSLANEIEYPLEGLNRPNPLLYPEIGELLRYDAIDFFVQKARSVLPNFQINQENAEAIIQICQLLDGLPLPIELAAARLKLFSPEIIWRKLEDNSQLLNSPAHTIIPRHQTITNTVKWSYDLLAPDEQEAFQQLSIFRGSFTIEALEAMQSDYIAIELVESFLNKSLVVKGQEVQWMPRFRILKLIRDFGWSLVVENPKRLQYFERFSHYYSGFLAKANESLQQDDQRKWLELMEVEYENIHAAFSFLVEHKPEEAIRMGLNFWRFHLLKGRLKEGLALIESLFLLHNPGGKDKAALLEAAGTLAHNSGAYTRAKDYFEACLSLRENNNNPIQFVKALNNIGWMAWRTGDYKECKKFAQQALAIANAGNDILGKATALNNQSWALFYEGHYEACVELQKEIRQIYTTQKNPRQLAFANINLGRALYFAGYQAESFVYLDAGIQSFHELQDQQLLAFARLIKAEILIMEKSFGEAKDLIEEDCLPGFKKISDLWGVANASRNLGLIALYTMDLEESPVLFEQALELAQRTDDQYGKAEALFYLGLYYERRGSTQKSLTFLKESLSLSQTLGTHPLTRIIFQALGTHFYQQADFSNALYAWAAARFHAAFSGPFQVKEFDVDYLEKIKTIQVSNLNPPHAAFNFPYGKDLDPHLSSFLSFQKNARSSYQAEKSKEESLPKNPFLDKALQVITKNIGNSDFKVEDLAQVLHLSPSHLHRKLDASVGLSASRLIRKIRLDKAKELLSNPDYTITAIAYETGFRDPDYFYRVFKQSVGQTPGDYRKMINDLSE